MAETEGYLESVDISLGVLLVVCFTVGTIGNALAFFYFISSRRDLPTTIYILMTIVDFTSSITSFPVISELFSHRQGLLDTFSFICTAWGFIWSIIPYISVFLVLILSIIRTFCLMSPFSTVSRKLPLVLCGIYTVFLVLRVAITWGMGYFTYEYYAPEKHCMENATEKLKPESSLYNTLYNLKVFANLLALAVPLFPIIISAVISCWCVWGSLRRCSKRVRGYPKVRGIRKYLVKLSKRFTDRNCVENANTSPNGTPSPENFTFQRQHSIQIKATVTILILTISYIVFNLPVCVVYVMFTILWNDLERYTFFENYFSRNYMWGIVYVVLVVCNAAVNPIIYYWRIRKMKFFYRYKLMKVISVLTNRSDLLTKMSGSTYGQETNRRTWHSVPAVFTPGSAKKLPEVKTTPSTTPKLSDTNLTVDTMITT